MIHETTLPGKSNIKDNILQLVNTNISAINLIAEHLELSDDDVTNIISELVQEGSLKGNFTSDGLRFYRSDIKMPTIVEEPLEEVPQKNPKLLIPKAIILSGVLAFIAGQVMVRIFDVGTALYETSAGLVMLGLIVLFAGFFSLTKFDK